MRHLDKEPDDFPFQQVSRNCDVSNGHSEKLVFMPDS